MVNEAKGRLFKRKDDKYLIYVPVDLAEDSMFPFSTNSAVPVKISFTVGDNKLKVEKWNEEDEWDTGKQKQITLSFLDATSDILHKTACKNVWQQGLTRVAPGINSGKMYWYSQVEFQQENWQKSSTAFAIYLSIPLKASSKTEGLWLVSLRISIQDAI